MLQDLNRLSFDKNALTAFYFYKRVLLKLKHFYNMS